MIVEGYLFVFVKVKVEIGKVEMLMCMKFDESKGKEVFNFFV